MVELADVKRQRFGLIAKTPCEHQATAYRRTLAGNHAVVATGTGLSSA